MNTSVGVAIPSIPPRQRMLQEALRSVVFQTWPPNQISVSIDHHAEGATATRNRALDALNTEWVAFLDDDDVFLPQHLEKLVIHAQQTDADLVYPWFDGINTDFFRVPNEQEEMVTPEGLPFTPHLQDAMLNRVGNFIPITVLVKTELVKKVGGFKEQGKPGEYPTGEDYVLWRRLLEAGAKFVHFPERTWRWNGHAGHTSGRSWKMPTSASTEWLANQPRVGFVR